MRQKGLSPIIIILFLATLIVAGIYFYRPIVLDNILTSIIEKIEPSTTPTPSDAISPTTKPKKNATVTPTSQPKSTSPSTPTPAPTSTQTSSTESSPTPSPSPTENDKPGKKNDVPFVGG